MKENNSKPSAWWNNPRHNLTLVFLSMIVILIIGVGQLVRGTSVIFSIIQLSMFVVLMVNSYSFVENLLLEIKNNGRE